MSLRAFAAAWCGQAFLRELVLIYPTAAIMMQQQGVSALSLSVLFMIWSTAAVVLEVPSGVLADRMSRRSLLVAAGLIEGGAFLIWLAVPQFWGFAIGFVVWSLASALRSGTSEAFLHDTLAAAGCPAAFERMYGWEQAASAAGVTLALLLGGWAAEGGFVLPLLLSALAPWCAALLVLVALREPARVPVPAEEGYFGTLAAGLREIMSSGTLPLIVAITALLPTVYDVVEEFVPPLLHELEFSLSAVGIAYALELPLQVLPLYEVWTEPRWLPHNSTSHRFDRTHCDDW
jgi:MFS family permease